MPLSTIYSKLPTKFNLSYFLLCENLSSKLHDKIAFYQDDESLSYSQLLEYVKKCANYFTDCGLERNSKIGLLLPDGLEFVVVFLGAVWAGMVPVLINDNLSISDITTIINDSKIEAIVSTRFWRDSFRNHKLPCLYKYFLAGENEGFLNEIDSKFGLQYPADTDKTDPAFWLYTSGSTGSPKGVIHDHGSPIVAAENCAKKHFQFCEDDLFYSAPSMAFGYGLGTSLYMPIYLAASVVLSSAKKASSFIKVLNDFKPSLFFGVPNNYANILALSDISPLTNDRLKLCISSGEQLSMKLWLEWRERYGFEICEGIGSSESMHMFIANFPGSTKPGSSGKIVEGYEANLLDEQSEIINGSGTGMLQIKGEGFSIGYWNKPSDTEKVFVEAGVVRTGDIYRRDEENFYYCLGRKDGLLKTNGMWIFPSEIENAILNCKHVSEAVVIRTDNKGFISGASELVAFVIINPSCTLNDISEVKLLINKSLRKQFPKYKIPKTIVVLDEMPRTATGKINYNAILHKIRKEN